MVIDTGAQSISNDVAKKYFYFKKHQNADINVWATGNHECEVADAFRLQIEVIW